MVLMIQNFPLLLLQHLQRSFKSTRLFHETLRSTKRLWDVGIWTIQNFHFIQGSMLVSRGPHAWREAPCRYWLAAPLRRQWQYTFGRSQ